MLTTLTKRTCSKIHSKKKEFLTFASNARVVKETYIQSNFLPLRVLLHRFSIPNGFSQPLRDDDDATPTYLQYTTLRYAIHNHEAVAAAGVLLSNGRLRHHHRQSSFFKERSSGSE